MSQSLPDPFLSQESQPPVTPFSQRGQSQYRMRTPPLRPLSQELTQFDTRAIEQQREQQRRADADAAAVADRVRQEEDDAQQAAYDAQEAAYAAFMATNPSYDPYDFSQPLSPPQLPGYLPLSAKERAIASRVEDASRPVQRPYTFYGNQGHAAAAAEEAERNKRIAQEFVTRTNAARRAAEAARRQGQGQGQGGVAKRGGQRKTLRKSNRNSKYTIKSISKRNSKSNRKSNRKSNKHKM